LSLEQVLGQIVQRLDHLEGLNTAAVAATATGLPRAAESDDQPEALPEASAGLAAPTFAGLPLLQHSHSVDRNGMNDELNAHEALFVRYRNSIRETLIKRWDCPQIVDDSDDAGKFRQICTAYQQLRSFKLSVLRLGGKRVPDNVWIESQGSSRCIAFLHVANANAITARLTNLNQLVMRHRQTQFFLMRDRFAPLIRSKGGMAAMEAFRNGTGDGRKRTHWRPLDHDNRVALEFAHQLVSDVVNRELDLPLTAGLELLARHEPDSWVVKLLSMP
jgi:hypothetical protein